MPVQINEIVIKVNVDSGSGGTASAGSQSSPGTPTTSEGALVEKILEIIKEKQER